MRYSIKQYPIIIKHTASIKDLDWLYKNYGIYPCDRYNVFHEYIGFLTQEDANWFILNCG